MLSLSQVADITGLTRRNVDWWEREFINASIQRGLGAGKTRERILSDMDAFGFLLLRDMKAAGFTTEAVRRAVEHLREQKVTLAKLRGQTFLMVTKDRCEMIRNIEGSRRGSKALGLVDLSQIANELERGLRAL